MKNLKKLRESHGLSQQKFADLFNLSQQSVHKYENDISEPSIQTLREIADYFDTSVDYLVDRTGDPAPLKARAGEYLTLEEKNLLEKYRCLSDGYRSSIVMLMDMHIREVQK